MGTEESGRSGIVTFSKVDPKSDTVERRKTSFQILRTLLGLVVETGTIMEDAVSAVPGGGGLSMDSVIWLVGDVGAAVLWLRGRLA